VASALVSYAHEDQEFVLALVERIEEQGLEIRYDRVALHIGDSLIRAISQEITEGDFLIAVVSPDSVESDWCQKELALAATQGINEQRVKEWGWLRAVQSQ
jgi:TIR domain